MPIAKVVYHTDSSDTTGTTWIDVTDKTVNTLNLFANQTALAANGTSITGTVNFNIQNTDGTKTLGTMSLNTSTGEITATYIDIDVVLYYSSYSNFPQVGSDTHLYINKSDNSIWAWYDSTGYVQVGGQQLYTSTTSVGSASGWSSGSMTNLSVAANAPTLTVTNGTAPSLTITSTTVVTGITDQSPSV